jgi:hypothetical protein
VSKSRLGTANWKLRVDAYEFTILKTKKMAIN